jgi:hypothetical protein
MIQKRTLQNESAGYCHRPGRPIWTLSPNGGAVAFAITNGHPGTVVALAPSADWGGAVPPCQNTGGVTVSGNAHPPATV